MYKHGAPLIVAGIVFALFALCHIWRLWHGTQLLIGTTFVPTWVSVVALIVAAALSVWMFVTAACCCEMCTTTKTPRSKR